MLAYLFVILAIAVRFMPHPFAFTPVGASLLFFGARGPRRQWWIPLALFVVADLILTKLVYVFPFSWDHFVTFAWYGGMLWLGTRLRETNKPLWILGASVAGSISFFVLSNFAVWAAWGDMYPRTLSGLMACYGAGVPFFTRRAIEGDIFFTSVMFLTPVVLHAISHSAANSGDHIAPA